MKLENATILSAALFLVSAVFLGASNVPPCQAHYTWHDDNWVCDYSGSITDAGTVDPSSAVICVDDSASASISGTKFSPGLKYRRWHDDCGNNWTEAQAVNYSPSNWFDPPIPGSFANCGTYTFSGNVVGISSDSDCPGTVGPASPGTFTVYAIQLDLETNSIWWFNDETPAGYKISASASICGAPPNATITWSASGPASVTGNGTSASIVGCGASDFEGVTILATVNGTTCSAAMTVRAPHHLVLLENVDTPDSTWGYETRIHYRIEDQFYTVLPYYVPLNEKFTDTPSSDYIGADWRRGDPGGATVDPRDWNDVVQGEASGHTPPPVAPTDAKAGTKVYHWPGTWNIGSEKIGNGVTVKTLLWQKYEGYARHEQ